MPGRDGKRLSCRHRPTTAQRHDLGDRAPVNRDRQPLAAFDSTEHFADRVPQVTNGNEVGHVPDCSTCSHMWVGGDDGTRSTTTPCLQSVGAEAAACRMYALVLLRGKIGLERAPGAGGELHTCLHTEAGTFAIRGLSTSLLAMAITTSSAVVDVRRVRHPPRSAEVREGDLRCTHRRHRASLLSDCSRPRRGCGVSLGWPLYSQRTLMVGRSRSPWSERSTGE